MSTLQYKLWCGAPYDRSVPAELAIPSRRPTGARLLGLLATLLTVILLSGGLGMSTARADPAPPPVGIVIVTAGLTWDDVSAARTPALACLAERSGAAALSTPAATGAPTRAGGEETLHTGYRGPAASAPQSAGIPAVVDRLAPLTRRGSLTVIEAPSVPAPGAFGRPRALAALDARVAQVLQSHGGCRAASLPRTLLVSVAPAPGAAASLQVLTDSAFGHQALTSGATHQSGVVALTDLAPTILASHGSSMPATAPGQVITGASTADPQLLARDRSQAAALVDRATAPALGSWMLPGLAGLVVLAVPALARRPRLARLARGALVIAPLAVPAGLCAGLVPWWRAAHPVWALTGAVWAGAALLAVLTLGGPWRRHRMGPPAVAGALVAGIVLAECAAGSPVQLGSPLGAQAISGGRFYGLSNHLFGAVMAGALVALLGVLNRCRTPRGRVLATLVTGVLVAGVCVAPSMGADFGSMLVAVPVFGILALAVSGIRVRLWHVLVLGVGGAAAVLAVSVADWLRPPAQRTHLGRFIDDLASGQLLGVVTRKLAQNLAMVTGIWPLGLLMIVALALTVVMLMPARAHLDRLATLDAACPSALPVRVALAVAAWLGYAVNDTGPVLVAAALGVSLALWLPMLPDPQPASGGRTWRRRTSARRTSRS